MPLPAAHLVHDSNGHGHLSSGPALSEARDAYIKLNGVGKDKTVIRGAPRNADVVIKHLGDKPIDAYTSADAAALRDAMLEKGLSIASVKRNFSTIRSIINLTISEQGLDCGNAFARTFMSEQDRQRRLPIPIECIRAIQSDCRHMDDDMRWLGEAVGLSVDDIRLDDETPHINITPHPWRRLKTKGSERCVPLVGEALWAASRAIEGASGGDFLFPDIIVAQVAMPIQLQQL